MFICRACWTRALGITLPSRTATGQLRLASRGTAVFGFLDRRYAATAAAVSTEKPGTVKNGTSAPAPLPSREKAIKWKVKKHLQYLESNYKITEHVERTLQRGDFDEAVMLVREASRKLDLTVSWNHLIGYLMQEQKLHAAVKLYNEMKKREQLPNAQTYTILFRGFANSVHPRLAVSEAVRIYHSMMTSKRLKPNIIHMNAVLEVCGRAGDIDSLFSIVSTADDKLRSPDNRTYTIILNSLRPKIPTHRLPRRRPQNEEEQVEEEDQEDSDSTPDLAVVNQAKAIWDEVRTKWRKGKIIIDEPLVCAMGRILRHGGRQENLEILDLVHETMNIPRLDKVPEALPTRKVSQPVRKQDQPTETAAKEPIDAIAEEPTEAVTEKPTEAIAEEATKATVKPRIQLQRRSNTTQSLYAIPGSNTLSLILESLRETRRTTLGPKYWDLFVNTYKVEPDRENYASYLRLLRVGHASTKTADVIEGMPTKWMMAKTFRIGLSCCIKDNLNKHAFANATRIFKAMKALRVPDALSMRLYINATRANFRPLTANVSATEGKFALGRQIVVALQHMWEPFGTLTRSFSFSSRRTESLLQLKDSTFNERMEAMAVAKRMIAAMDFVVTEGAAEASVIKNLRTRRNVLNRLVARFYQEPHGLKETREDFEDIESKMPATTYRDGGRGRSVDRL